MGLLRNKGIWLVTGVLLLMQLVIIYVPLMQSMFWYGSAAAALLVCHSGHRRRHVPGGGNREASDAPVPQNGLNNLARLAAGARYCREDPL